MAPRVLSTEQAKTAIQQVQAIINGGLTEQISKLDAQGKILSTPDVWDGPLAQQFLTRRGQRPSPRSTARTRSSISCATSCRRSRRTS